jgi:hypothetical protein
MKSKIVLFLVVLFSTVVGIAAQPGCRDMFNPFYICQSNFEHYEYLFYGESVSTEDLKHTSPSARWKSVVKVRKNFKGDLPKEITLYYRDDFCSTRAPKNNSNANNKSPNPTFLYVVSTRTLNGQKVYFVHEKSRPMTDYSAQAIKEVFKDIESVLSNQKKDFVQGVVYEPLLKVREVSLKSEDFDRLSLNSKSHLPLANIFIEVISEKDGKLYQARSKADGSFRIDNIPNGNYKVKLDLPAGMQQGEPFTKRVSDSPCSRKWGIPVY